MGTTTILLTDDEPRLAGSEQVVAASGSWQAIAWEDRYPLDGDPVSKPRSYWWIRRNSAPGGEMSGYMSEADAHLIAAAPDMLAALNDIGVGGNHLASILIGKLGPDFASKYPPDLDTDSALRMLCATTEYDVWCCWAAIMRARNIVIKAEGNTP